MKILLLNGSPKPVSDTMVLTNAFLKGLNASGRHEVTKIDVINRNIAPCTGCFGCFASGSGRCVIDDDQNAILSKIVESDVMIWSFPLYCYGMPSHLKAVVDRMIPLSSLRMQTDGDRVWHESRFDFSKLHTLVISGCGFPDWDGNFDGLRIQCRNSFPNLTCVFVPETPLLNIPEAAPAAEPLLGRFTEAGREYEKALTLSPGTVAALETPMLPKEVYLADVNASAPN